MQIRYLTDEHGQIEAVVVPIQEWKKLVECGAVPRPIPHERPAGFDPDYYYGQPDNIPDEPGLHVEA